MWICRDKSVGNTIDLHLVILSTACFVFISSLVVLYNVTGLFIMRILCKWTKLKFIVKVTKLHKLIDLMSSLSVQHLLILCEIHKMLLLFYGCLVCSNLIFLNQ